MEDLIPNKYYLSQNYPNPFNDKTIIKYCIPEKMKVKLEVFGSNNRKVKILIDEIKEAGTHKVEFNAENFERGEYLYKLESKEYFESKKMIVLK